MEYWDYFRDEFDWADDDELTRPDIDLTRRRFAEMGYAHEEVEAFIRSGYVVLPVADSLVVDRLHGGALMSEDGRTRFRVANFRRSFESKERAIPVYRTTSRSDLLHRIELLRASTHRRLLFRGQVNHYALSRERPNPNLAVRDIGEVSFLPSLWRNLWKSKPTSFMNFTPPAPSEWQEILSHLWPMGEIARRAAEINAAGGWIHSFQDMEDSDDPLLQEYARLQLDVMMGAGYNLADTFNTLLQHYGLVSPVLDLTSDLDVALFFATNKLIRLEKQWRYKFVGSNIGRSVLYVFREDTREMSGYGHERVLDLVKPLRPLRQSCVICRSGPFAMNLAADFLVGIIQLAFEPPEGGPCSTDLFPDDQDDRFLGALKSYKACVDRLIDFSEPK